MRAAECFPITVCYLAAGFAAFTSPPPPPHDRGDCIACFAAYFTAGSTLTGDRNEFTRLLLITIYLLFKMSRICLFNKTIAYTVGQVIPKNFVSSSLLIFKHTMA